MKNVIIFHGTGGNGNSFWIPYTKKNLEAKGYSVQTPNLPNTDAPKLDEILPFALNNFQFTQDTILIGHSIGGSLILSILENIDTKIHQAILVAGFHTPLPADNGVNPMIQDSYNWEKIKTNVEDITFINSDNDPWKADDIQGREMFNKLGGTLIIRHDGHMGSESYNQPYTEFPLLIKLVD